MRRIALAILLAAVVAAGVRWGTFVAGGSDSYCYVHQAERWASLLRQGFGGQAGRLQVREPLAAEAPWPDAALTFTPSGHRPSPTVPGAIVPICPAGLSLVMAPLLAAGGPVAMFLVVPLFGALLVAATYAAGARFGQRIGLASAMLIAASPVFLFQLVQPMSDVPAAALWMLAVAAVTGTKPRGAVIAGLATSAAILMRPNLVPLGIPLAAFLLLRPERPWRERLRTTAVYAACAAPGCIAVALIQNALYGSPFSSGYGALDGLFAVDHIGPNASRYLSWLSETHTPVWILAAAAPFLLPGALTRLFAAMFLLNLASYLPYVVFDDWSYLRFLLPTIPLVLILAVAAIDAVWRRMAAGPLRGTRPTYVVVPVAIVTVALVVFFIAEARERSVFRLQQLEARYARAGEFVDRRLPANAIVITSWQSGSVRFYSGRKTLTWDVLDPAWIDRTVAYVRTRGLEPFLLFEGWEEPIFRQRFAASPLGALDWPPMAEVASQVRIYRPGDRELYLQGIQPPTEYAR